MSMISPDAIISLFFFTALAFASLRLFAMESETIKVRRRLEALAAGNEPSAKTHTSSMSATPEIVGGPSTAGASNKSR